MAHAEASPGANKGYLAGFPPSASHLLLLSLALLLSSGVFIKTFHPKHRFLAILPGSAASKAQRRRESVLKSIMLAQGAAGDSASGGGATGGDKGREGGRSRSASHNSAGGDSQPGRSRTETCVASTSAAIAHGLSFLTQTANASFSSSTTPPQHHERHEPTASGSKTPPSLAKAPARAAVGAASSPSAGGLSGDSSVKRGKQAKKGKGVASSSLAASTAGSPILTPSTLRRPMTDATTSYDFLAPVFLDAGVQTFVPHLTQLHDGVDAATDPHDPPMVHYPFLPISRPSSPTASPSRDTCSTCDATAQTSPHLFPTFLPYPPPSPFNLHASFQSHPSTSYLGSPSSEYPPPPPSTHPNNGTGSAPRSRKQRSRASLTPLAPMNTVVGMTRVPSREHLEDGEYDPRPRSGAGSRMGDSDDGASLAPPNGKRPIPNGMGKAREVGHGLGTQMGTSNGSGMGRYGIPAPIPIPGYNPQGYPHQQRTPLQQRSSSAQSMGRGGPSYFPTSAGSSPYFAHPPLLTMSPDPTRRMVEVPGFRMTPNGIVGMSQEQSYWSMEPVDGERDEQGGWALDGDAPGLGVEIDPGEVELEVERERQRSVSGRSWSEAAGGSRGTSPSMLSAADFAMSTLDGSNAVSGSYFPPLGSTTTSPSTLSRSLSSADFPQQHAALSHPTPRYQHPQTPSYPQSLATGSRPSSRQSSLSVPGSSHQQQQHHLAQQQHHQQQQQLHQQQQAFAYAQAHAQYRQAVALQYQAHLQQQEHDYGPNPLAYPPPTLQQGGQTPQGWVGPPPSPGGLQYGPSPTTPNFPPMYPYYIASPDSAYFPGYHPSQRPQSHQPRTPKGQSRDGGSRKGSTSMTPEKARSVSAGGTLGTDANVTMKTKLRTAEIQADRNGKELEIARWRLTVLEEDRITNEVENQEALSALATRAMRAEARIKLLEEVRAADSSSASASGSGSPVTRPSSVIETIDLPAESLPLEGTNLDDLVDPVRFPSPPGKKIHPLAWLDLNTISLTSSSSYTRPPFVSSPTARKPRGNRWSVDNHAGSNSQRRRQNQGNGTQRRRSSNQPQPDLFEGEEDDDDDILIVLDSPIAKRKIRHPTGRSLGIIDDEAGEDGEHGGMDDDDTLSNLDLEEMESTAEGLHVDYIGSLPTFLETGRSPSTASSMRGSPTLDHSADVFNVPSFVLDFATPPLSDTTSLDEERTIIDLAAALGQEEEEEEEEEDVLDDVIEEAATENERKELSTGHYAEDLPEHTETEQSTIPLAPQAV